MAVQDSVFTTSNVLDNEIIKASDFNFAFETLIENVAKSTQMMLESTQDFVINGKVTPYSGMNVQIAPIYGVCKSTGVPFGRTESAVMEYGFEESEVGRVDIIQVRGAWETYDNQQRAFNDPDTDTQTYQYVDTKKLMRPTYQIKKGVEGSSVAPTVDSGWVKLAEVEIRANASTLLASDIKNITADVAGMDNDDWTNEKDETYNIGYISDVNARFRVQHNEDGTHADDSINQDSLDIGIGAKQINGNVLPIGTAIANIPTQTANTSNDAIALIISRIVALITSLYDSYLKYNEYNFKGELCVSAIADENNALTNAIKISADGSGNATIKIGSSTVLSIDTNGKLHTNGYAVISTDNNNTIVTKAITDAINTALNNLKTRVDNIESTSDVTVYTNGVLSAGTDGRYNVYTTNLYVATTQNVTLSGSQAIDGVTPTDGVLVLVKNQTDAKENGIYQYSSLSDWARINDFLTPNSLRAKVFNVSNGTTNGGKMFYMPKVNFVDGDNFGEDDINFVEYFGSIKKLPNKVAVRDNNGRLKTANSAASDDCVARGEVTTQGTDVAKAIFNYVWPIGCTYTQYPKQKEPNTLFPGTTWQLLNYGGAFFRSSGGNADTFEKSLNISSINGTTITFASAHGLNAGSVIYDYVHNEGRTVASVTNTTTVVLNSAFSYSNMTNVLIGQSQATAKNGLKLNSSSDFSGTANQTTSDGNHRHPYSRANSLSGSGGVIDSGTHPLSYNTQYTDYAGTHSHSIYLGSNDTETRPSDFTYKIWVRTA